MKRESKQSKNMKWWQLALFGVGCTIGTGFFLGSAVGIQLGGPSLVIGILLAGLTTYIVFDALARLTAEKPEKGAFRTYAKQAFGHWAGFSIGWMYWFAEILIMGSQLTALSIFSRFWFPAIPLWLFALGYAVLGIFVLLIGAKGLSKIENIFAVLKLAAIVMFIVIAAAFVFGFVDGAKQLNIPNSLGDLFPTGFTGFWASLIFAFYAFGGIEVMGLMAIQLKDPKEAPKSGRVMVLSLVVIYVISLALALVLVPWDVFQTDESPFIVAFKDFDLGFVPHLFNGALIIAGFSTMVASFYGVTTILVSLAQDKDAPAFFAKEGRLAVPFPSLGMLVLGLAASIIMSLALPEKIYTYITTGAGLMLLYNWLFIILSARRLQKVTLMDKVKYYLGILFLLAGISGTLLDKTNRPGFFISVGILLLIGTVAFFMNRKWKKEEKNA
ncbi:amino acid/polyamine/organocation transporter, APC superfamily [Oceanobacillus limi]|uniref:Amino acid/polyamine/organocation transporter, APC superfamily n=1 Tax=Oceanobacillus limi TaxID=930131 RepID=A0A1H9YAJ3_9BACI|nr:amino acid permease [Oceanobacillus limi]SES65877.1 amino acid/polyamine/organocation transporter, APC superfamily [Oceanobacillus limi]